MITDLISVPISPLKDVVQSSSEQKGTEQPPASAAGPCHPAPHSPLYQEQLATGCRETSREEFESGDRPQSSDFGKGMK